MTTYTAVTTLPLLSNAEALGEAMENLHPEPTGVGICEIGDGKGIFEVGGYFVEPPDDVGLALLASAFGSRKFIVSKLPETDWIAEVKRELGPVQAGRFFLYGSHDADKVPADVVPLAIEAALAFGTGHHATTQGCLMALDKLITQGFVAENTVDIGCGTAVLAMAAAKVWPAPVLASDIDEVATQTSRANVIFNGLEGRIEVVTCPGFEHVDLQVKAPFDLVFANILKGPLVELAAVMKACTGKGAMVILSGLLNAQAADVTAAYNAQTFALTDHLKLAEWSTLTFRRQ